MLCPINLPSLSLFLHAMHAADISVNYGSKLGFQMGFLSAFFPFLQSLQNLFFCSSFLLTAINCQVLTSPLSAGRKHNFGPVQFVVVRAFKLSSYREGLVRCLAYFSDGQAFCRGLHSSQAFWYSAREGSNSQRQRENYLSLNNRSYFYTLGSLQYIRDQRIFFSSYISFSAHKNSKKRVNRFQILTLRVTLPRLVGSKKLG